MVRLSSHRLPFSLSSGTTAAPPPIIIGGSGGWVYPRLRQLPRPRRKPRHTTDSGLVELRLSGSAIDRMSARESGSAALRLRLSALVEYRVQDGDLMELYLVGILSFDDLLLMASDATIEAALLLG